MKKYILNIILLLTTIICYGQQEIPLLGTWSDSTVVPTSQYNNKYNEIWGMAVNGHEYAIIGSTFGTHIIDVTDPSFPVQKTVIKGGSTGPSIVHRDFHDYKGYLYAACQEGGNSSLQIINMNTLPDSATVVYDSRQILDRTHNIFIDTATHKLYVLLAQSPTLGYAALRVVDIEDPLNPTLLASHSQFGDYGVGHVHDAYVRNDTAYLNCGPKGLVIADFIDPVNPNVISILPTSDYEQSGYNHSGWLTEDGKYYIMADETHDKDMKIIDVQNLPDLEIVTTISPNNNLVNIPHNQLIKGNYLYASYYYDGLQVWNIENPLQPILSHYYDTCPIPNTHGYAGAWGVYPHLPSGNILVSDMQLGLFVLQSIEKTPNPTIPLDFNKLKIFPNPTADYINIAMDENISNATITVYDNLGKLIYHTKVEENNSIQIDIPNQWSNGLYRVVLKAKDAVYQGTFDVIR